MGYVEAIFVAEDARAPMQEVPEARAVPGRGLEGDRYFSGKGQIGKKPSFRELTLIEAEAVEAAAKDYGLDLLPADARRNIVTRGVALNHYVGKELSIGEVRVRGMKLCEPCLYLEKMIERPGVKEALLHRGGLRVEILNEGVIRKGDEVQADTTS